MTQKQVSLLKQKVKVINMGIGEFADSLVRQGVDIVHVSWSPPAAGNKEMMDLLEKLA